MAAELSAAIRSGMLQLGGTFERFALHQLSRMGFEGQIAELNPETRNTTTHPMRLYAGKVRYFVDNAELSKLVGTDFQTEAGLSIYVPLAANDPLVDAFCVCKIQDRWVVAGLQMTVAARKHPVNGESVAKAQFDAIRAALWKRGVRTAPHAWLLFVLPALHFRTFLFQRTKEGKPLIMKEAWRQAKLAVQLNEAGQPAGNVGEARALAAASTTIELTTASAKELSALYQVGGSRAADLLTALNGKRQLQNAAAFLRHLRVVSKVCADVLMLPQNVRAWSYNNDVLGEGKGKAKAPT